MHGVIKRGAAVAALAVGLFILNAQTVTYAEPSLLQQNLTYESIDPNLHSPTSLNRDCTAQKVVTRPFRFWLFQKELSADGCAVEKGSLGSIETSQGLIRREGSNIYGQVYAADGRRAYPLGSGQSDVFIHALYTPAAQGTYFGIVRQASKSIQTTQDIRGEVVHRITIPSMPITDISGNRLIFNYDSVSFSSNGEWMIGDVIGAGMTRVDLETGKTITFGPKYNYDKGYVPGFGTAISNDGRYVITSVGSPGTITLYDVSTCSFINTSSSQGTNCIKKDLVPELSVAYPGLIGISYMRFYGDSSLKFKVVRTVNGTRQIQAAIAHTASSSPFGGLQYLALGDSFSSGEGAFNYRSGTDIAQNKCHISTRSYPYLIGAALNLTNYQSVACSGAKTFDVKSELDTYQKDPQYKITGRDNDKYVLDLYLPGYIPQSKFIEGHTPEIATISIGGNDIGFSNIIAACLAPISCYNTRESRIGLLQTINSNFSKIVDTYNTVKKAGDPRMRLYVVGYPQIISVNGACGVNVRIDDAERLFAVQLTDYLNETIRRAASQAGITYVDISAALVGHRLCEDTPDTYVNGLTAGNDIFSLTNGPIGKESYHPNYKGHEAMQRTILDATTNLTSKPNGADAKEPIPINNSLPILQVPTLGGQVINTLYQTFTQPVIVRGEPILFSDTLAESFTGTIRLSIHSTPTEIGTIQSATGASAPLAIPANIEAGWHTLHAVGTGVNGEPLDIAQSVYVAASVADIDGDGIPNTAEACLVGVAVEVDTDKDGIDDGCDGFIGDPPILTIPVPTEPTPEPAPEQPGATTLLPPEDSDQPTIPLFNKLQPSESSPLMQLVVMATPQQQPALNSSDAITQRDLTATTQPTVTVDAGARGVVLADTTTSSPNQKKNIVAASIAPNQFAVDKSPDSPQPRSYLSIITLSTGLIFCMVIIYRVVVRHRKS